MATIALNYYCDLNQAVKVQYIDGNVFSGDNAGNTISVFVMDGDQPASIGGSVSADVIRADGSTVAVSGALDGNRAYVILPQACYAVPGSISIVIKNTQNTTITTIAALVGNVYRSSTDTVVDPGTIIPSISSLIASIDAAIGSIPADYSALLATIAADYSSSKTYPVGAYCWEAGVLKRCIVPITTPETYTAAHWTNAVIGDDLSALKSAFKQIWTDQIVGMEQKAAVENSSNLFKYAELIGEGKAINFVSGVTGKVVLTDNENYNTYLIPVDGNSIYTFTNCRTAVVVTDRDLTAVSEALTYITSVDSTGGTFIVFSFNPTTYPVSTYSITKPVNIYQVPSNWDISNKKIETEQIVGMIATGKNVVSSNIFSEATLVASGKYVDRITNGKAVLSNNSDYDTYIIPVNGVDTYTFTNVRTGAVVSDLEYTAVGSLISNATEVASTGGKFILFSFKPATYPVSSYSVTHPIPQYEIPVNWKTETEKKPIQSKSAASIADGGTISLTGKTAIKYGYQIIYKCFLTSFSEIKLAFYNYNNSAISNSVVVNGTNMIVYVGATAVDTFVHNLTISNDFTMIVDYKRTGVEITIESNGSKYVANTTFERLTSGVVSPTIVLTGTVATDATFSMVVGRAKKSIWYFGDSYISFSNPARWTYYLCDYDYDGNTLLNGYAGGTSATTVMALTALLEYGKPEIAVFATGMNDGSDSSSAPSTSWVNARNSFIALCEANGIEIVFCTVPTVPSVNNEQKNSWVRASEYRYIDFAKAVGANASGVWYTGMLSQDNVHPTENGAVALFTQVLKDLPEILE